MIFAHGQNATPANAPQPARGAQTFRLLTLGAAGMTCLIALLPAAGHDQMWCLYAARLMRHGARLYGPELFESNPPLIVWLSLLPSWLAGRLGIAETALGKALVAGLAAAVAMACLGLLRRLREASGRDTPASLLWALGFVYVSLSGVVPARDFGQRDHILALLCLPYLFAAALDGEGLKLPVAGRVAIGIAAGLGLALKPHQVLIPVAVEAVLLVSRSRGRSGWSWRTLARPEPMAMLLCGIAYGAAIRGFAPDYLFRVVPVLRDTYWAFGHLTWLELMAQSVELHILAACTLGVFFATGWRRGSLLEMLLITAGLAATLAFYWQGTGWYYQQLPALTFFALALVLRLVDEVERRDWSLPRWAPGAAGGLAVLALGLTTHFAGYPFTLARSFPIDVPDPAFFASLRPGDSVATLTTTVDDTVPPLFRYGLTLGQRYPHLWMLPAILRSEDPQGGPLHKHLSPARLAELDGMQHRLMVEDLARWHPRLLLVERCQDPAVHCQVLEDRHDDLLAWFLRDPAFQSEFARYRYWRSAGTFDAYVLK